MEAGTKDSKFTNYIIEKLTLCPQTIGEIVSLGVGLDISWC